MQICNTAHPAYKVRNLERSLAFYVDGLGLKKIYSLTFKDLADAMKRDLQQMSAKEQDFFRSQIDMLRQKQDKIWVTFLEVADRQCIELFPAYEDLEEFPKGDDHIGYLHLALEVDDIHKAKEELTKKGIKTDEIRLGPDFTYQMWMKDPDGNPLELMEYTPKAYQLHRMDD